MDFGIKDQEPTHEHENDREWVGPLPVEIIYVGGPSVISSSSSKDPGNQELWLDDCLDPEHAVYLKRHICLMILKKIHYCLSARVRMAD